MGGKGPGAGFDLQAHANAFVAVSMLANRQLRWTQMASGDVPISIRAESGGPGDDVRIELQGSNVVYECQSKRGLSAGLSSKKSRLAEALTKFAALSTKPDERGILIVDPTSADTIRTALREGLDALRQGLPLPASGTFRDVHEFMGQSRDVLPRLHVLPLDLELDASAGALLAVEMLTHLMADPTQAYAAWMALRADGLRMCREGGRRTRTDLVTLLTQANMPLSEGPPSRLEQALSEGFKSLRAEIPDAVRGVVDVDQFTPQLDTAKALLDAGKYHSVLDLLDGIVEKARQASPDTRARLYNLRGSALFRVGREGDARVEYLSSLALLPHDQNALGNLAQVELALGNRDEAIRRADELLGLDPLSTSAWMVIVQADPARTVPPQAANVPGVLAGQAVVKLKNGLLNDAVALLRKSLDPAFNEERAIWLADALFDRVREAQGADPPRADLNEAHELLRRALDSTAGTAHGRLREHALLTRGHVNRLLGDTAAAEADFAAAVEEFPASVHGALQLGNLFIEEGQPEKALVLTEHRARVARSPMLMLRAHALFALDRHADAVSSLKAANAALTDEGADPSHKVAVAFLALESEELDLAEEALGEARPAQWLEHFFRARIADRRGQADAARASFEQAASSVPITDVVMVRREFANFLRRQGDTRAALKMLKDGDPIANRELRSLYGRLLYEDRRLVEAFALVEHQRAENPILPPWALQLGANIAQLRDDVHAAAQYLRELYMREPGDVEIAIRFAHALIRLQNNQGALEIVDAILSEGKPTPRELVHLAELYIRAGRPAAALPLAYRAVRAEPDAEDIQLAYISIFMKREADQLGLEADVVRRDTGVVLKFNDGEELRYFIVTDHAPRVDAGEVALDDPIVEVLLGKKKGDTLSLKNGATAVVEAVNSGYVHVYQDALMLYRRRFPGGSAIVAFKLPEDPTIEDLGFVTESLRELAETRDDLLEKYSTGGLPLGFVATMARKSLADAYHQVRTSTVPLLVEYVDAAEQSRESARAPGPVIVTRTALVTAEWLGLLSILTTLYPTLIVPRSLLDELDEELTEWEDRAEKGHDWLEYRDGVPVARSISAEEFAVGLSRFRALDAWVRTHCVAEPRPLESLENDEGERLRTAIGASSADSVALAKAMGAQLYADDLGLRRLLRERSGLWGFCTYSVLTIGPEGVPETPDAEEQVAELIRMRHAELPLSPLVFCTALMRNGYRLDGRMTPLLDRLRAPGPELPSLVGFIIGTLSRLAVSGGAEHVGALTYVLIEAAAEGRDARKIVSLVERVARLKMQLLPVELDAVIAALQRYVTVAISGTSLLT